ncbi:MAG: sugar phosphate nucleotidyltransferase [Desulfobacterales bacterium]|nr:sugar phosphate nucleotidyltransferase [Desulfobacterales bacterium]
MKRKPKTLAMILAGGRVDDLGVLTFHRPKSAIPFGGFTRIIDFSLSNLMNSGLERVAILSQYRSYSLINHIGIGSAWDMIGRYRGISVLPPYIGYGHSQWYRGSSDAIYQNLDFVQYIDPEQLLILSGDHIYQMDYREMISYHREKDADLTMACLKVPMNDAHRFGVADIDDEDGERGGKVLRYSEKPENPESNWASMTVFCFKPEVLYEVLEANIKEDASYEFGRDIIPRMMREKRRVFGYKFKGYWGYTGTIEEFWQANMDLLGGDPPIKFADWNIRTNMEHRNIRDCQPVKIGNSAQISDSLIYNGCIIEGEVERSILFPGTYVAKGAKVKDSVLLFKNDVGKGAELNKIISDVNTIFGSGVRIGEAGRPDSIGTTVIGWNNFISPNTIIGSGCTVYPSVSSEKIPKKVESGEVVR